MNRFGNKITLTTFGESHGKAIGGVIDGFPVGIKVDFELISREMASHRPGRKGASQRREDDIPEFLSGISEEGITLGTPIGFIIPNKDTRSGDYSLLADRFRPNHADYTWQMKYGIRDHRGGGRTSARETACRVVGGAFAMMLLQEHGIEIRAKLTGVGEITDPGLTERLAENPDLARHFDTDAEWEAGMMSEIEKARMAKDSVGGRVTCIINGVPAGLGEPLYDKLNARLAEAMMGINAVKAFEIGLGTRFAEKRGSEVIDKFIRDKEGRILTETNYSGGIQGGLSNGMPIVVSVYFKPTPTIGQPLPVVNEKGEPEILEIPGRHDPCVALRAVPVVKAMAALTLAQFI